MCIHACVCLCMHLCVYVCAYRVHAPCACVRSTQESERNGSVKQVQPYTYSFVCTGAHSPPCLQRWRVECLSLHFLLRVSDIGSAYFAREPLPSHGARRAQKVFNTVCRMAFVPVPDHILPLTLARAQHLFDDLRHIHVYAHVCIDTYVCTWIHTENTHNKHTMGTLGISLETTRSSVPCTTRTRVPAARRATPLSATPCMCDRNKSIAERASRVSPFHAPTNASQIFAQ